MGLSARGTTSVLSHSSGLRLGKRVMYQRVCHKDRTCWRRGLLGSPPTASRLPSFAPSFLQLWLRCSCVCLSLFQFNFERVHSRVSMFAEFEQRSTLVAKLSRLSLQTFSFLPRTSRVHDTPNRSRLAFKQVRTLFSAQQASSSKVAKERDWRRHDPSPVRSRPLGSREGRCAGRRYALSLRSRSSLEALLYIDKAATARHAKLPSLSPSPQLSRHRQS